MDKKNILITNDDGITANGIRHLYSALHDKYNITIVAPASEKSGSSLAMTMFKPLHIRKIKWDNDISAYSITGTPIDCVKLALRELLPTQPDLIVSGINKGSNAGKTVLYSGTVGAVIEGALRGITGIAFSCVDYDNPNYSLAEKYIPQIVQYVLDNKPKGTLLNVNFPNDKIKGIKLATQGKSRWIEDPDKRTHPEGHSYYWLGGEWQENKEEKKTSDIHLLNEGYITAVPIKVNELTDHDLVEKHQDEFEKLF